MQGKLTTAVLLVAISAVAGCDIINSRSEHLPNSVATTYEYWMTGGFAGSSMHLQMDSLGSAKLTYTSGSQSQTDTFIYRLSASELDTLRDVFQASGFFYLEDLYKGPLTIMDGFNYKITCNTTSATKSVSIVDYPKLPIGLGNLLGFFYRISERIMEKGYRF